MAIAGTGATSRLLLMSCMGLFSHIHRPIFFTQSLVTSGLLSNPWFPTPNLCFNYKSTRKYNGKPIYQKPNLKSPKPIRTNYWNPLIGLKSNIKSLLWRFFEPLPNPLHPHEIWFRAKPIVIQSLIQSVWSFGTNPNWIFNPHSSLYILDPYSPWDHRNTRKAKAHVSQEPWMYISKERV